MKEVLRLLLACDDCGRQFDATHHSIGSRFHCSCGEILTVPEARAHDAAVVRCSSCGGPRSAGENACRFCDSDFTLHEKDLHTICPECMARISDTARYCHHCATPITPQGTAGEESDHLCPGCDDEHNLYSRILSERKVSVLECETCTGLWLDRTVFEMLEQSAQQKAVLGDTFARLELNKAGDTQISKGKRFYRPCPICKKFMHRKNYGRGSGVIIDICTQHGIWFDHGELDTIIRWIKSGGLIKSKEREKIREAQQQQTREVLNRIDHNTGRWKEASGLNTRARNGYDLLGGILDYFLD